MPLIMITVWHANLQLSEFCSEQLEVFFCFFQLEMFVPFLDHFAAKFP